MPQLPSGQHFALDVERLHKLIEDAFNAQWVHELMAIEKVEDLYPYIGIVLLRPAAKDQVSQVLAEGSLPVPEALEPLPSGHNLGNAHELTTTWSKEDQVAFNAFLNEPRLQTHLQVQLQAVEKAKERLLDKPDTTAGLLATYWKLGCHPLQEKENEAE
ncbi:MAG: hypothetical protein B7Z47_06380 [Chthoniobacter sp. 12-60-6]|nr:MAG: hypothetical protein B7Z47_06380 [Chthoniobacter sp. 12-60-6]